MSPSRAQTIGGTLAAGLLILLAAACRGADEPLADRATHTEVRELPHPDGQLVLPLRDGSVRFAVIGDSGRGDGPVDIPEENLRRDGCLRWATR